MVIAITWSLQFLSCFPSCTLSCRCRSGGLWGDPWRKEEELRGEDHQDVSLQTGKSLHQKVCVCFLFWGCESNLCLLVLTQSPQHVDIAEVFADQCRENLERSPCKDIFSNCRKWGPAHSHLSPGLRLEELPANGACCSYVVCLTQGRPRLPELGPVCRLPEQHVLWPVPAVEGAREV